MSRPYVTAVEPHPAENRISYIVADVPGDGLVRLVKSLAARGLPHYGDTHKMFPGLHVVNRLIEQHGQGVKVSALYGYDRIPPPGAAR